MGAATRRSRSSHGTLVEAAGARKLMRSPHERRAERAARVLYQHWVTEGDRHRFLLCPSCGDLLADFSMVGGMLRTQLRQCGHVLLAYDCSSFETGYTVIHDPEDLFSELYDSLEGRTGRDDLEWALRRSFDRDQVAVVRVDSLPFTRQVTLDHAELHRTVLIRLSLPQAQAPIHPLGRVDFEPAEQQVAARVGAVLPEPQVETMAAHVEPDRDLVKRCVTSLPRGVRGRLASDPAAWSRLWEELFTVPLERAAGHAARLVSEATGLAVTEADLEAQLLSNLRAWWAEIARDWLPTALPRLLPLATGLDRVDPAAVVTPELVWESLAGRMTLGSGAAERLASLAPDRWH